MLLRALPLLLLATLGCRQEEVKAPEDVDADGYPVDQDCDDLDPDVHPDADEVCNGTDDDCDGLVDEDAIDVTTWYADGDGDRFGTADDTVLACEPPQGYVDVDGDCDDTSASVNPSALELCDGIDNDCDTLVDGADGDATDGNTWYEDLDEDGYGSEVVTATGCSQPPGYVAISGDHDDANAAVNPGAVEVCNGVDDDCDGRVDEDAADASTWYEDLDGDGHGTTAATVEACEQPEGYAPLPTDCDDTAIAVSPDAPEACNGIDDDCDGMVDEEVESATTWYADADGDGFGVGAVSVVACAPPTGFALDDGDCDDTEAAVHPGGTEVCDGLDNDCSGAADEGLLTTYYADADGDGFGDADTAVDACAAPEGHVVDGTDCDDTSDQALPGGTEVCDGLDNDCSGAVDEGVTTTYYADADGDGYGDAATAVDACAAPEGHVADGTDCDDDEPAANPGETEVCDGLDNDCSGAVDEDVTTTYYADADGDGYGVAAVAIDACAQPAGFADVAGDCDDTSDQALPGGTEVCDGLDNDCSGAADEGLFLSFYADGDGDGYGDPTAMTEACTAPAGFVADDTDCDDASDLAFPGGTEVCDGLDNDCSGAPDEGLTTTYYADDDGDGYGTDVAIEACSAPAGFAAMTGDCDDASDLAFPGGTEVCDGLDNDCSGDIDEGLMTTYYADADGDGYGVSSVSVDACAAPSGFSATTGDCDDTSDQAHPGGAEVCDGLDNDCSGATDDGVTTTYYADDDGDGYGSDVSVEACSAPAGFSATTGDCDDTSDQAHPGGAEVCDGLDNDCSGAVDEGVTTTYYADADADGQGNAAVSVQACSAPSGFVTSATDCDDDDAATYLGAPSLCDDMDRDCDGSVDDDNDGDSWSDDACGGSDCDDTRAAVSPDGTETCNGLDDDCDGVVDPEELFLGDSATCAAYSCLDLHYTRPSLPSGEYWVNPGGSVGAVEAWCDMVSDGGGYTVYKVDHGTDANAATAEAYCADRGMRLFIPRSQAHLRAAWHVGHDTSIGPSTSGEYLYIMGVYPNSNGTTCSRIALHSGSSNCNWHAGDRGGYWVSNSTGISEPNGDNCTTCSMYYRFNSSGDVTAYNDVTAGYSSRYFTCQVGDMAP